MAKYRISSVQKNSNDVIKYYSFHTVGKNSTSRAQKKSKSEAIEILENKGFSATTWIWNYSQSRWNIGENMEVVNGRNVIILRSNPNETSTDNLALLIDYDWISP